MTTYTLQGVTFNASSDDDCGAFHPFNPERPESFDPLPYSMVEEMKAFIRLTDAKRRFVDVGALYGLFSLVFTRHPDAVAYAIEPSPWAWPILKQHIDLNPQRTIVGINNFAGATTGEIVPCGKDWHHVVANRKSDTEINMSTRRLDDMPELWKQGIDCMKIDVEGYECQVLQGARRIIEEGRPLIFLECHLLSLVGNESPESLFALLNELGYDVRTLQGESVSTFSSIDFTRVVCHPR
jgi:FkbM family methyltransferase